MTSKFVITTFMGLCIGLATSAQTFTQRLQKTARGGGVVSVHHSQEIDKLVNGPYSNNTPAATAHSTTTAKPTTTEKTPAPSSTATPKKQPEQHSVEKTRNVAVQRQDSTQLSVSDTSSVKKAVRTYKVMGYRVQVFAGGNSRKYRQHAEQVGNELRMLFTSEAFYVHFYSPRWICRLGNFRTYQEAHKSLVEVRKMGYSAATIVKGKITVPY